MFKVRIRKIENGEVVKEMESQSLRAAERIERGALINLNKDKYYVDVEEVQC